MATSRESAMPSLARLARNVYGRSIPDLIRGECSARVRGALESGKITRAQVTGICRKYACSVDPRDQWSLLTELVKLAAGEPTVTPEVSWMDDAFVAAICGPEENPHALHP